MASLKLNKAISQRSSNYNIFRLCWQLPTKAKTEAFGTPNKGSALERTMENAMKTGKIQAGEAGLSGLRKNLEKLLGMKVDVSIIKKGGAFDNGAQIPVKGVKTP